MGRMKKIKTEGGILYICLIFLPCMNKSDDDGDDEGGRGVLMMLTAVSSYLFVLLPIRNFAKYIKEAVVR